MIINTRGQVTPSRFYEGVRRSRARLSYSQVRRIMDNGDPELVERYGHVLSSLQALYDAYRMRLRLRERRGALDFDSQQAEFRFDEKGQVVDIDLQDRKSTRLNSSHVAISYAVFCLKKKNNNT